MKEQGSYTVAEATVKAEAYCVYQDRCHLEVTKKLKEMNMIPQAIDHILNHLIQNDFLNEERFARNFARGKFRIKKWGKQRIVKELKYRNISRFTIKAALSEIDPVEYQKTFEQISIKKWESLTDKNPQQKKKKLTNYLFYRGWEADLVYEMLNRFN